MRKQSWFMLVAVVMLCVFSLTTVAAQEKVALVLGQFVKGNISSEVNEVWYSFAGKAGDLVTLEVISNVATLELDPTIELRNSNNETIALNDDFNFPFALAIAKLPADGDYVAVVGRAGGADGETQGEYSLRVSVVEPVGSGSTINAEVNSDANALPQLYILNPAANQTIELTFTQAIGENYAGLKVLKWISDSSPDVLVNLDSTAKMSKATLTVELEGDNFYVLQIGQTSYSFTDAVDFPVTIQIN